MKRPFFYVFFCILILLAPRAFADISSNTDFNPFPQMEQDQQNVDDDTAARQEQQNNDNSDWPVANSETQQNSEGSHE